MYLTDLPIQVFKCLMTVFTSYLLYILTWNPGLSVHDCAFCLHSSIALVYVVIYTYIQVYKSHFCLWCCQPPGVPSLHLVPFLVKAVTKSTQMSPSLRSRNHCWHLLTKCLPFFAGTQTSVTVVAHSTLLLLQLVPIPSSTAVPRCSFCYSMPGSAIATSLLSCPHLLRLWHSVHGCCDCQPLARSLWSWSPQNGCSCFPFFLRTSLYSKMSSSPPCLCASTLSSPCSESNSQHWDAPVSVPHMDVSASPNPC